MGKPISHSWILAIAAMAAAMTACGKLTPNIAGNILEATDPRTFYVHLHTGKHVVQEREERFQAGGLTEFRKHTDPSGNEEIEIFLTPLGVEELKRVRAKSCGATCWSVPLGERTNILVKDLIGGQEKSERVVFTWELRPNTVGRAYEIDKTSHEGTADFKYVSGHWILAEMNDGAPAP
jgi:hypothetical protein